MGINALEGLAPEWYTPAGQDDDDRPTRFQLRPLNGRELGLVADYLQANDNGLLITGEGVDKCLRLGLADWENFNDSSGPVRYSAQAMDRIPMTVRRELASVIVSRSFLGEDERKN